LGFVPVAIHFDLFDILVTLSSPATAEEVTTTCNARIKARGNNEPELSTCLTSVGWSAPDAFITLFLLLFEGY
jgi:hypothetical protein